MRQFFDRTFWCAIAVMFGLYILGLVGFVSNFSWLLLLGVGFGSAWVAFKHIDKAIYLVFIELFSNPHGAILQHDVLGFPVSLRMAVFFGVMFGWGIGWLQKRYKPSLEDGRAQIFALLALASVLGFIIGNLSRDPVAVFQDGNAYLYLLYLLPILSVDWDQKQRHKLLQVLAAGAMWVSGLSLFLLYVFSHFGEGTLAVFYTFFRDLRVAEITKLTSGAYRVFIQSQAFVVLFSLLFIPFAVKQKSKRGTIVISALLITAIVLGLSRSFWVGIIPAIVFLAYAMVRTEKPTITSATKFFCWSVVTVVCAGLILVAVTLFPIPSQKLGGISLINSIKDRTQSEDVAISSRWNLLTPMVVEIASSPLVGAGFGAPVTFETDDPRARAINPDGTWTTTAMEWGWLELWLKMGILGPIAFLYAAYELIRRLRGYAWSEQVWVKHGLIAGIVFLYATHVFSPYLNHPIGLGFLLFIVPFIPTKKQNLSESAVFMEDFLSIKKIPRVIVAQKTSSKQHS